MAGVVRTALAAYSGRGKFQTLAPTNCGRAVRWRATVVLPAPAGPATSTTNATPYTSAHRSVFKSVSTSGSDRPASTRWAPVPVQSVSQIIRDRART